MKKFKHEFRMWVAEVLLGWAFGVADFSEEGARLKKLVYLYFRSFENED